MNRYEVTFFTKYSGSVKIELVSENTADVLEQSLRELTLGAARTNNHFSFAGFNYLIDDIRGFYIGILKSDTE